MFKAIRTGILLGLVCFISAFCLAQVYQQTKDKISAQNQAQTFLKKIFARGEVFEEKIVQGQSYYLTYGSEKKLLGVIIPVSTRGYGGKIKLLVGLDLAGRVVNFQVLEHSETPGLGAKIEEPEFQEQFKGKGKFDLALTRLEPQEGKIEGITSATISSQAVIKGIREAIEFFENNIRDNL